MNDDRPGNRAPGAIWGRTAILAGLGIVIGLGLWLRWAHLLHSGFLYDGDEAFIALMGLRMAKGQAFPLIQHGAHYMGTADAAITALLLRGFGISVEMHKMTHLLYAGLAMALLGWIGWRLWGWGRAYAAVGLLAVAPSAIRWQIDANTNYGISLALECGVMALTVAVLLEWSHRSPQGPSLWKVWWLGLLSGLAFWQYSLIVSLLLALVCVAWLCPGAVTRKTAGIGAAGFLIGASPLLIHNATHSFATVRTFLGFFLDISSRREVEEGSVARVVAGGLWKHLDPIGLGANLLTALRGPSFGASGLLAVAGPVALGVLGLLVVSALVTWLREARSLGWRRWLAAPDGVLLGWLLLSIGLAVFFGSTRARYLSLLLPLLVTLVAGKWPAALLGRTMQAALLAGLILYLTAVSVMLNLVKPDMTVDPIPELVRFLEAKGLRQGYADYNIAYPILLYSQEAVTVSPLAGPVMTDRFRYHTKAVEQASAPFYIYEEREPLKDALTGYLHGSGIRFDQAVVGRYLVIWNLSRAVRPDEFLPPKYLDTYRREHDGASQTEPA
ncbi:MAG: hypothetical protein FJ245_07915 [Nitrospira sp.]|nr:hypothetical protein [Nitrospira sp.]